MSIVSPNMYWIGPGDELKLFATCKIVALIGFSAIAVV